MTRNESHRPSPILPVFVYGTLRPGWGNAARWRGRGEAHYDGEAILYGYRLTTDGGFPYAKQATDDQIVGALIVPDPPCYDDCLMAMDALEGHPGWYLRTQAVAHTPTGYVRCWVYTNDYEGEYLVPDNDWNEWTGKGFAVRREEHSELGAFR